MSTSECLGTSVMSGYGRIRSEKDLPDHNFRQTKISMTGLNKLVLMYSHTACAFKHLLMFSQTFNVKVLDIPNNLACTTKGLLFHSDLTFYESPPGLQMLHCIRYSYFFFTAHTLIYLVSGFTVIILGTLFKCSSYNMW